MRNYRSLFLTTILLLSSCGRRTIIEAPGTVGVLTKPVIGATVAFPDKDKNPVESVVDLPVGTLVKTAKGKP